MMTFKMGTEVILKKGNQVLRGTVSSDWGVPMVITPFGTRKQQSLIDLGWEIEPA